MKPPDGPVFVTRHRGAAEWARRSGRDFDIRGSWDPSAAPPCPVVAGTLPVHLAAAVCRAGGRYFHLVMDVPEEERGRELTADEMERLNARLVEFRVEAIEGEPPW